MCLREVENEKQNLPKEKCFFFQHYEILKELGRNELEYFSKVAAIIMKKHE